MNRVARTSGLFFSMALYVVALFCLVNAIVLRLTLVRSQTLKTWMVSSDFYANFRSEQVSRIKIDQNSGGSVEVGSSDIQTAANDAFDVESFRQDAEGVIDGTYDWLKGESSVPQFSVDLTKRQAVFASDLKTSVTAKVNALPVCTGGSFSAKSFDLFSSSCRPAAANAVPQLTAFEQEVASNPQILPKLTYDGGDMTFVEHASWAPKAYRAMLWAPLIAGVIVVACMALFILLGRSKRLGVRRIAHGLAIVGAFTCLVGVALGPGYKIVFGESKNLFGLDEGYTVQLANPLLRAVAKTFSTDLLVAGLALTVPALFVYGSLILTRHKRVNEVAEPYVAPEPIREEPYVTAQQQTFEQTAETVELKAETDETDVQTGITEVTAPHIAAEPPKRPVTRRPPMIQG